MAVLMGWASVWEVYEAIATHQGHTNISSINLSWIGSINPVVLVSVISGLPRRVTRNMAAGTTRLLVATGAIFLVFGVEAIGVPA